MSRTNSCSIEPTVLYSSPNSNSISASVSPSLISCILEAFGASGVADSLIGELLSNLFDDRLRLGTNFTDANPSTKVIDYGSHPSFHCQPWRFAGLDISISPLASIQRADISIAENSQINLLRHSSRLQFHAHKHVHEDLTPWQNFLTLSICAEAASKV